MEPVGEFVSEFRTAAGTKEYAFLIYGDLRLHADVILSHIA
jgi:hypothetical protein